MQPKRPPRPTSGHLISLLTLRSARFGDANPLPAAGFLLSAAVSGIREEAKPRDRSCWLAQPPSHGGSTRGECRTEQRSELIGSMPVCAPFGEDKPSSNVGRHPTPVLSNLSGETRLAIEHAQRIVDVDEFCLDLDDEQCARRAMPREDVHPAALAIDGERNLWCHLPT